MNETHMWFVVVYEDDDDPPLLAKRLYGPFVNGKEAFSWKTLNIPDVYHWDVIPYLGFDVTVEDKAGHGGKRNVFR